MSQVESVIVVGASAAGISCIRKLRNEGFLGSLVLVDKDQHGAYERPPLSKQILLELDTTHKDIALISDDELTELNIEAHYGDGARDVDPTSRTVTLESGKQLTADVIVLATGGEARRLPIEGADLSQVLVLRNYEDALNLRQRLTPDARVAVIGGGFIGAETTASLSKSGFFVHWLDAVELPMAHLLPQALCEKIVANTCAQGVELVTNCRIKKFAEQADGKVSILFENDSSIEVDAIVMGVGMTPKTPYFSEAIQSKILNQATGGIQVDENQATQFSGIYAAGDVAAVAQADGSTIRHEHWQSAQHQGERAAAAILNKELPETPVDWFWSDQGDLHIEMAGKILPTKEHLVTRLEGDWPVYFSVVDNRVIGAVSVNNPNAVRAAMRMIKNDIHVDPLQLADPELPLRKLMRG
ncbi:NAD(P)/FAD-dependent oxidoreductase [Psychrobacter sp. H8-1]|uniref:NAD(P)/FAD-dependent oxidoreductase n=1 Tax=Psychrobacter sp. H8-1 TaxID=2774129 RepID=UPI0019183A40|nr:FAD-dependent oxidoreductase [Psychrobacter sp. H8-1]